MTVERPVQPPSIDRALPSDPERWVDDYGDYLYRCALLRLRDPKTAEDIVQETLLSALESRDRFAGRSSERSWLVGILKHKVIDHFRKTRREAPIEAIEGIGLEMEGLFDEEGHWKLDETGPSEWGADPGALFERKTFWIALERCLGRLPGRTADAFVLREIDGLESEAICQALQVTTANLWVLLHRARMQLRLCIEVQFFGGKPSGAKI